MDIGPNTNAYLKKIKECINIHGDVAEFGVYKGKNSYHYASLLESIDNNKKLHLFDSFSGFPDNSDGVDNIFKDTSLNIVKNTLSKFKNVVIHDGFFEDTFKKCDNLKLCCSIIDCDLYDSYKICLDFH